MRNRIFLAACWLLACAVLTGCGRPAHLSPSGHYAYELSLASDSEHLVAAWHGGKSGNAIWVRRTDAAGKPVGSPIQLTDGQRDAYEPDIQLVGEDLLLGWYEKEASTGALTARLGRFSQQGQPRWQLTLSAPEAKGRNVVVRVHADQALVAWIETPVDGESALWTARVGIDGAYVQPPQHRVPVSTETWNLNAAVDNTGALYVVYDAKIGSRAKEMHLLVVSAEGVAEHVLSSNDGHDSTYPDVSLSGEHAALTWFDSRDGNSEVYLFVGDIADLQEPVDNHGRRITDTPGQSIGAYIAWNGDRLGLAWCDDSTGQSEVFSQEFDLKGSPLGAALRRTRNPTQSSIPSIRPWRDGFALAWNEYQQATDDGGHPGIIASTAVLSLQ
jgi:hypothetical protein